MEEKFNARLTKVEVEVGALTKKASSIESKIDTLIEAKGNSHKTNWGLILSFVGLMFSVVIAAAKMQSATLETRLAPLELKISILKEGQSKLDEIVRENRHSFSKYVAETNICLLYTSPSPRD